MFIFLNWGPSQKQVHLLQLPEFGMSPFTPLIPSNNPILFLSHYVVSYLSKFYLLAQNCWCTVIVKRKTVPLHTMQAFVGRGRIAPTCSWPQHYIGVSGQCHAPAMPRFTPRERTPSTHWIGGWMGPRASLDAEAQRKILCPCRGSNPGHPVHSQTLYCSCTVFVQLSIPRSCLYSQWKHNGMALFRLDYNA
jgi:hypothetical protein